MDFVNFIFIAVILFLIGIIGIILNRKNVLLILMSFEIMLLSVNLLLLNSSSYLDDRVGQLYALFILCVAAAETSIGLAILINYYRIKGTITLELITTLKG